MAYYGMDMSPEELHYFIFKKKKCPICGESMKRQKKIESLGKGFYICNHISYGNRYKITMIYKCIKCNKTYSLNELAENKNSK